MKRLRGARLGLRGGRIKGEAVAQKITKCSGRVMSWLMIEFADSRCCVLANNPLSGKGLHSAVQINESCNINEQACKKSRQDFSCFGHRDEGAG